ncbi:hypothetical protein QUF72_11765 [Desulfobacterales bacterium HSG2]|nr:hypothetical protein [Desulfobacterales bacterium HSG2]
MKPVVADATPIRYLTEIRAVRILPYLFGKVFIPNAVFRELTHRHTPKIVHDFIVSSPEWLEVRTVVSTDHSLSALDPGEREAILLADEIGAEVILLDEKAARNAAEQRGVRCVGTLRILSDGAKEGQIDIYRAVSRLRQTTFRAKPALFEKALSGSL